MTETSMQEKGADLPVFDGESTAGLAFNDAGGEITLAELDALPTDDGKLAAALAERAEQSELTSGVAAQAQLAGQLLGSTPARPAVRAALYRYLANHGDSTFVGADTAEDGTRGTAVTWSDGKTELRVIVDATTSRLLAWELRDLTAAAGTDPLMAYEIFRREGWVATIQDRPAG
jgi:hypothetical protein